MCVLVVLGGLNVVTVTGMETIRWVSLIDLRGSRPLNVLKHIMCWGTAFTAGSELVPTWFRSGSGLENWRGGGVSISIRMEEEDTTIGIRN